MAFSAIAAGHELEIAASPAVHTAYFVVKESYNEMTAGFLRGGKQMSEGLPNVFERLVELVHAMRVDVLGKDQGGEALTSDMVSRILANPELIPESLKNQMRDIARKREDASK